MAVFQSDLRSAIHMAAAFCYLNPLGPDSRPDPRPSLRPPPPSSKSPQWRLAAVRPSNAGTENRTAATKPSICTADELHYVSVRDSNWRLALWRYRPSPKSSFARYMSSQGFDTWVLEFRGAGLSAEVDSREVKLPIAPNSQKIDLATKIKANSAYSGEDMSDSLVESEVSSAKKRREVSTKPGTSEARQNSDLAGQIKDLSQRLANIVEEGQRSVSRPFLDLLVHCSTVIEDFQKRLDLIVKYNWDFDHYLEADVPAANVMADDILPSSFVIGNECNMITLDVTGNCLKALSTATYTVTNSKAVKRRPLGFDPMRKVLNVLIRIGCRGGDSKLASVVTLASSLDYTSSKSSLRFILPLADPAQVFNVPVVPLGALLAAAHPLASRPPYVMSWLKTLISAENMMHPELLEKLVLTNFCMYTIASLFLTCLVHPLHSCDLEASSVADEATPSTPFTGGVLSVPRSEFASDTAVVANTRIDWKETPEAHVFKADLSGLKKEEVKVEVEEGRVLQISGERNKEKEEKHLLGLLIRNKVEKMEEIENIDRERGTVPTKLLLQLSTAFHDGGLCNRSATIFYKDRLHKSDVPILALAGDQDLICPPEAVYERIHQVLLTLFSTSIPTLPVSYMATGIVFEP
ncbi:hypothetical protein RJ639_005799 [Escallonia herrerae]|uniref:SHSP domain-containing protein n=1 Tax=Escallonia herrerae TaxID=1293975 RepID=A0AA88VYB7_9ASTE|nr:hypothetical protein RJ639_005799 [Escallonia herrerae]